MNRRIPTDHVDELGICFKDLAPVVFRFAFTFTRGDRALSEDLVQQTFEVAAENWPMLRALDVEARTAWLRRVAANLAISRFRHNEVVRNRQPDVWRRYRPPEADTFQQALSSHAVKRCWEVIERMPNRQRVVALLYWRVGMKIREIAEALGISEGAASAHLSTARKKLIAEVAEEAPGMSIRGGGSGS